MMLLCGVLVSETSVHFRVKLRRRPPRSSTPSEGYVIWQFEGSLVLVNKYFLCHYDIMFIVVGITQLRIQH
jgi:hypothetical protein